MEMQAPQWWSLLGMHVKIDDWFNAMAFHLFFLPMNPQILKASKSRQDVQTNEEVFGNKCLVLGLFRCALCADLIPSVAFPLVFTFYFFPCLFSPCLNCRLVSIILWPFFFSNFYSIPRSLVQHVVEKSMPTLLNSSTGYLTWRTKWTSNIVGFFFWGHWYPKMRLIILRPIYNLFSLYIYQECDFNIYQINILKFWPHLFIVSFNDSVFTMHFPCSKL